ncbi:MAG TPA: T9SS type A sorting domain-containing protein, partial [Chitinivibrionales bacterium]
TLPSQLRPGAVFVRIFDLSGKNLFAASLEHSSALVKISNAPLAAGAYYVSLRSKDISAVIPFVKTK